MVTSLEVVLRNNIVCVYLSACDSAYWSGVLKVVNTDYPKDNEWLVGKCGLGK